MTKKVNEDTVKRDHDGDHLFSAEDPAEKQWYRLHDFTALPENIDVKGKRYMGKMLKSWVDYILKHLVVDIPEDKAFLKYYKKNPKPTRKDYFQVVEIINTLVEMDRLDIIQERVVTIFATGSPPEDEDIKEKIQEIRDRRKISEEKSKEKSKEKVS